jgi:DNA repair protein RecO (recombination protein O)
VRIRTYKIQGIVIKRINYSEADKILTVFTRYYGKVHCLAKGIRKLTSRKAASLELFNLAAIFLAKGKNLDIITEAKIINSFSVFRKDLKKVALAYKFCELIDRLTADNQSNSLLFSLLKDSLLELCEAKVNTAVLAFNFKKKLLQVTGFGLPKEMSNKSLDDFLEKIIEKKINTNNLLKTLYS